MLDSPSPLVLEKLASCISEVGKRHLPTLSVVSREGPQHVIVSIRGTTKLDASGFDISGAHASFRRLVSAGVPTHAA